MEDRIDILIVLIFVGAAIVRGLKAFFDRASSQADNWQQNAEGDGTSGEAGGDASNGRSTLEGWLYSQTTEPPKPAPPPPPPSTIPREQPAYPAPPAPPPAEPAYGDSFTRTSSEFEPFQRPGKPASPPPSKAAGGRVSADEIGTGNRAAAISGGRRRAASPLMPTMKGTPGNKGRNTLLLDLRDRRKLRLAILTREVIERPRAFDI